MMMNFAEQMGGGGLGKPVIVFKIKLIEGMMPPNDQNMNYYQEYCRLFIANVVLTNQLKELIAEKNEIMNRLTEYEVFLPYHIEILYLLNRKEKSCIKNIAQQKQKQTKSRE